MNERSLDHVGIAVPSLDDAIPLWTAIVGATPTGRQAVDSQATEVVFLGASGTRIELLAPTRADSPVARFLERRGPGLHHVAYRVDDIRAELKAFEAAGFEPIDAVPREGAQGHLVAFLHPRSAGGVLVELVEHRVPEV